MVVLGFDVGKDSLVGVRSDNSAQPKQTYEIPNTKVAIEALLRETTTKYPKLLVASEATNEYHRPLALTCLELGIPFRLLNPITTKQFTRATVRKRKTDLSDALVIAKLALQGEGTLVTPETFGPTKPILRTSMKLTRMTQMLHLMQQRLAYILPSEEALRDELAQCQKRLEAAIRYFREQGQERTSPTLQKLLMSIPGIGVTISATLIAELGDIRKFPNGKALVAYAGLDPRVRQSGLTLKRNTRLTKRGSPYLRRAIYIAATIAQRFDPELKTSFDHKRAEGKRYKEATIVVGRKLLYRVYAVWTRGTPYEKEKG
jgi:transposase